MGAILLANLDETISNVYFEYELEWRLAWEIFIGLPLWKTILIPLDLLGFKWKILIFFFPISVLVATLTLKLTRTTPKSTTIKGCLRVPTTNLNNVVSKQVGNLGTLRVELKSNDFSKCMDRV